MRKILCLYLLSLMGFGFAQELEKIDTSNWVQKDENARQDIMSVPTLEQERQALIDRDTYNNARKNPIWCPTDSLWQARRLELGIDPYTEMACPTEGVCDDPAVRDSTVVATKKVNIYVHLMRNDNGSGGVNINSARAAYQQMLADYASAGITFNLVGAQWINNSTYATIPAYSPFNNNWFNAIQNMKQDYAIFPKNVCNIFVSAQQSSPFGTLLGIATFPWEPQALTKTGGLWLNNVALTGSSHTFAHELGHCFGLWHTHHGVSEVASCSACYEFASGVEGDIRGDFCSDTPSTPTNYQCVNPNGSDCQGTPWGATQPENFMSYAPDSCQNLFSQQQTRRMHCWLPSSLPLWIVQ